MPRERITEESEDTDDIDTASIGDIGESSNDFGILPPGLPSPAHTRSSGKAKKEKEREPFDKGYKGKGVMYLPGEINGLIDSQGNCI